MPLTLLTGHIGPRGCAFYWWFDCGHALTIVRGPDEMLSPHVTQLIM
jgi:hypothetical protein